MRKILTGVIFICSFFIFTGGVSSALSEEAVVTLRQEEFQPRCSSHQECARQGFLGICQSPGEKTAKCLWQEIVKVPVTVIEPDQCRSCQTQAVLDQLRMFFPGIEARYIKASESEGKNLLETLKINMLPAYILGKVIEQEESFAAFSPTAILAGERYYLKPEFAGVSYFLNRKALKSQLDLFFVMTSSGMSQAAKIARDIDRDAKSKVAVNIHFLGLEDLQTKAMISPGGEREINENKIYACVEKYHAQKALDYLVERLLDMGNVWIDDILQASGCDVKKIKACAKSREGENLYRRKVQLSQELDIRYAPLFLMDNREIFGVSDKTTAEEILKMLK